MRHGERKRGMLGEKKLGSTTLNNRILWIFLAFFVHFFIIGEIILTLLFTFATDKLIPYDNMSDGMVFVLTTYLVTFLPLFIYVFVYTGLTKKNRYIFKSFLPGNRRNKFTKLLDGIFAGFFTNFLCILVALLRGDIKLSFDGYLSDIPFYLIAFLCVMIQSATEELWTRGFLMERIRVHYPVWLAAVLNAAIFAALHLANTGISPIAILNIFMVGFAYSVATWETGSIWYAIGAHTAWNFTQNLVFGLPNSGLVSRVSLFRLEAANANDVLFYDTVFGVEGSLPATIVNLGLALWFLYKAYKKKKLSKFASSMDHHYGAAKESADEA